MRLSPKQFLKFKSDYETFAKSKKSEIKPAQEIATDQRQAIRTFSDRILAGQLEAASRDLLTYGAMGVAGRAGQSTCAPETMRTVRVTEPAPQITTGSRIRPMSATHQNPPSASDVGQRTRSGPRTVVRKDTGYDVPSEGVTPAYRTEPVGKDVTPVSDPLPARSGINLSPKEEAILRGGKPKITTEPFPMPRRFSTREDKPKSTSRRK